MATDKKRRSFGKKVSAVKDVIQSANDKKAADSNDGKSYAIPNGVNLFWILPVLSDVPEEDSLELPWKTFLQHWTTGRPPEVCGGKGGQWIHTDPTAPQDGSFSKSDAKSCPVCSHFMNKYGRFSDGKEIAADVWKKSSAYSKFKDAMSKQKVVFFAIDVTDLYTVTTKRERGSHVDQVTLSDTVRKNWDKIEEGIIAFTQKSSFKKAFEEDPYNLPPFVFSKTNKNGEKVKAYIGIRTVHYSNFLWYTDKSDVIIPPYAQLIYAMIDGRDVFGLTESFETPDLLLIAKTTGADKKTDTNYRTSVVNCDGNRLPVSERFQEEYLMKYTPDINKTYLPDKPSLEKLLADLTSEDNTPVSESFEDDFDEDGEFDGSTGDTDYTLSPNKDDDDSFEDEELDSLDDVEGDDGPF